MNLLKTISYPIQSIIFDVHARSQYAPSICKTDLKILQFSLGVGLTFTSLALSYLHRDFLIPSRCFQLIGSISFGFAIKTLIDLNQETEKRIHDKLMGEYNNILMENKRNSALQNREVALIITSREDPTNAFDIHPAHLQNIRNLAENFRIKNKTVSNTQELKDVLKKVAENRTIKILLLCAHGDPYRIQLGKGDQPDHWMTGYETDVNEAFKRLSPDGKIILFSCNTADKNQFSSSIAQRIAHLSEKTVFAPKALSSFGSQGFTIAYDEKTRMLSPKFKHIRFGYDVTDVSNGNEFKRSDYGHEIREILALKLHLPQKNKTEASMTINRQGQITQVDQIQTESSLNKEYLNKHLPQVQFLPMQPQDFPNMQEISLVVNF